MGCGWCGNAGEKGLEFAAGPFNIYMEINSAGSTIGIYLPIYLDGIAGIDGVLSV